MGSLWGEDFDLEVPSKDEVKTILEKMETEKTLTVEKALKSKKIPLVTKLLLIKENVIKILGRYQENTQVIKTYDELKEYIDRAIENGIIAIDTETNNSLDPITCKIMGGCIYTPGQKNAYIPMNHTSLSGKRLDWQITEEQLKEQFSRLSDTKILMHNAKFDYQVIKCTCGLPLKCYWDTLLASRILNELESAGLKQQYVTKIDSSIEKYSIEHLFSGVEYAVVEPEIFALYAATDAFMTYKLYEWQKEQFALKENERLYSVFMNIEMNVLEVTAEMELTGVCIDKVYAKRLSDKYHKKAEEVDKIINDELLKYKDIIAQWRTTKEANYRPKTKTGKLGKSKNEQLADPVEITSPTQLAILLYDILKAPVIDKDTPRGTGEDIISKLEFPICKAILEKRGIEKLIGTYIDKLPECVSPKDGRLHAHFNQIGTDTGRFSSSDPNLQNIPSHEKSIRLMFKATDGYAMIGSDYSQQEPRLLAFYAQDDNMINAYKQGRDLYSTIASGVYHNKYEDNLEHNPDGTLNPEGKKRRSSVKSLMLGIMYGMGVNSIATSIHGTMEEAQTIVDSFYKSYPKVKAWIDGSKDFGHKNGYVEDIWGRRRRLPDLKREPYSVTSNISTFNPFIGANGEYGNKTISICEDYKNRLSKCKNRNEVNALISKASSEGVTIKNNNGFIAQAERQCANARIQGGAASMSKKAMIKVYNDVELKELGFRLLIAVHDELIGECPIENVEKAKERVSYLMRTAALPECDMPMKCDAESFPCWYYDEIESEIKEEYENGATKESLFEKYCELTENQIMDMIGLN